MSKSHIVFEFPISVLQYLCFGQESSTTSKFITSYAKPDLSNTKQYLLTISNFALFPFLAEEGLTRITISNCCNNILIHGGGFKILT